MNLGESNIVEDLKSGTVFPDEIYGWSTKTILALLLVLLLAKIKMGGD
jgi:hypothetical protein